MRNWPAYLPPPDPEIESWQDRFAEHAEDILFTSFADVLLQRRWLLLTMPDDYVVKVFNWTIEEKWD